MKTETLAVRDGQGLRAGNRKQWVKPTIVSSSLALAQQGTTTPSADAANGFS